MFSIEEWYFAYGSNLKKDRLRSRIGDWKQEQKALLRGYKLTFAKGFGSHTSGKANIKSDSGSQVEGAIYLITKEQFKKLDKYEGVEIGVYKRITINVELDGKLMPVTTYVMVKEICPLRPSAEYLDLILEGFMEHGYKQSTIRKVKEIARDIREACAKPT